MDSGGLPRPVVIFGADDDAVVQGIVVVQAEYFASGDKGWQRRAAKSLQYGVEKKAIFC